MSRLAEKYRAWRARRNQALRKRWKRERARGEARFVLRVGIIWGGCMIIVMLLTEYIFYRNSHQLLTRVIYYCIVYPIGGLIVGLVSWRSGERKYNSSKIDVQMKSPRKLVTFKHNDK